MALLPLNDEADCLADQHENRVGFPSVTTTQSRSPLPRERFSPLAEYSPMRSAEVHALRTFSVTDNGIPGGELAGKPATDVTCRSVLRLARRAQCRSHAHFYVVKSRAEFLKAAAPLAE